MHEARVNHAMVKAAQKVVAVCDPSRFNRRSVALIFPVSAVHHVITDSNLPAKEVKAIQDLGIEVTPRLASSPHIRQQICIDLSYFCLNCDFALFRSSYNSFH